MLTASTSKPSSSSFALLVCVVLIAVCVNNLHPIQACDCLPTSIYQDHSRFNSVFRVKVIKKLNSKKECRSDEAVPCELSYWVVKLRRHFGPGCSPPSKKFVLSTTTECCLCGFFPKVKKEYLIFAEPQMALVDDQDVPVTVRGMSTYNMDGCSANTMWSSVSKMERKFLEGRSIECDGEISCVKQGRTKRFVDDSCEISEPCVADCGIGPLDEFGVPAWTIECIPTSVCEQCGAVPLYYNFSSSFGSNQDGINFVDSC